MMGCVKVQIKSMFLVSVACIARLHSAEIKIKTISDNKITMNE